MRGVGAFCVAFLVVTPAAARAQSTPDGDATALTPAASQPSSTSSSPQFLGAYRVRMSASRLAATGDRFAWDGRFTGDVDLVAYGRGRVNFMAEYEVVLGRELRPFDPNQSLYTLDLRLTRRYGANEFTGLFHHVSRHLNDRPKTQPIDWNAIGVEGTRTDTVGSIRTESLLRADWIVKHSFVDYAWRLGGRLRLLRPATPRVTLLTEGSLDFVGTDASVADRNTQVGAYLEGGARLGGLAGSLDLILAFERRVDADPLIRGPKSWILVGFRLVAR